MTLRTKAQAVKVRVRAQAARTKAKFLIVFKGARAGNHSSAKQRLRALAKWQNKKTASKGHLTRSSGHRVFLTVCRYNSGSGIVVKNGQLSVALCHSGVCAAAEAGDVVIIVTAKPSATLEPPVYKQAVATLGPKRALVAAFVTVTLAFALSSAAGPPPIPLPLPPKKEFLFRGPTIAAKPISVN